MTGHTVTEVAAPTWFSTPDGVEVHWPEPPPPGLTDEVDRHECAAGPLCAGWNGCHAATVGFSLDDSDDDYRPPSYPWDAWVVNGQIVVCGDCANEINEGSLTVRDGRVSE